MELIFTVTKEEADLIANALAKMPLEQALSLWTKIQQQAKEQLEQKK